MSESYHAYAIQALDEEAQNMADIWHCCKRGGVDVPDEVIDFFEGQGPDDEGRPVQLDDLDCCNNYSADMKTGLEIDLTLLPANVKKIRFFVSY